jgi:plastocyanin
MRILLAPAVLAALLVVTGCAPTTPGTAAPDSPAVSEAPADSGDTSVDSSLAPTLVDEPESPDATLSITATTMDPATVSIPVGGIIVFVAGDDGFHGLVINELSSVTVTGGLTESYQFTEAGTYLASDELGSGTATIVVG